MWTGEKKPKLDREQLLAAAPLRSPVARVEEISDGGVRVTLPLRSFWFLRMPAGATKSYDLDEIGKCVWDRCDGRTSVLKIIESVARQYKINLREAEVATLKFLQVLSQKRLIGVVQEAEQS